MAIDLTGLVTKAAHEYTEHEAMIGSLLSMVEPQDAKDEQMKQAVSDGIDATTSAIATAYAHHPAVRAMKFINSVRTSPNIPGLLIEIGDAIWKHRQSIGHTIDMFEDEWHQFNQAFTHKPAAVAATQG